MSSIQVQIPILQKILSSSQGELFHTSDGIPYVDIIWQSSRRTYQVEDPFFTDWLTYCYYAQSGEPLRPSTIKVFLSLLRAEAIFNARERSIYQRVAEYQGQIYLDLGHPDLYVEIGQKGWGLVETPPVRYRRSVDSTSLPLPQTGGCFEEFFSLIDFMPDDRALILTWLVCCLNTAKPYPLLVLQGEEAARTVLAQMLKNLVDPIKHFDWLEVRTSAELAEVAAQHWVLPLEEVPAKLLVSILNSSNPMIVNVAGELFDYPELLDRSLLVTAAPVEGRYQRQKDLWEEYEKLRPRLLATLLEAASLALAKQERTKLQGLPWTGDFLLWANAAESALGLETGAILQSYNANRQAIYVSALEDSPLAMVIWVYINRCGTWCGTASQLLKKLKDESEKLGLRKVDFPGVPNKLSTAVRMLMPILQSVGIEVDFVRKGAEGTRLIQLRTLNSGLELVAASPSLMLSAGSDDY